MNGYDCEFCHYEHDRKRKAKPKRKKSKSGNTAQDVLTTDPFALVPDALPVGKLPLAPGMWSNPAGAAVTATTILTPATWLPTYSTDGQPTAMTSTVLPPLHTPAAFGHDNTPPPPEWDAAQAVTIFTLLM